MATYKSGDNYIGKYPWTAVLWADVTDDADGTCSVRIRLWKYQTSWGNENRWTGNTSFDGRSEERYIANINANAGTYTTFIDKTYRVSKGQTARNITASGSIYTSTTSGNAGTSRVSVSVTIPGRVRTAHGKPHLTCYAATAHFGQEVTLSWSKADTQGNANWNEFELYANGGKVYETTDKADATLAVTPSDVTGPRGGTVTYTLREYHEWYGSYPYTEASVTVDVSSGVVTVYGQDGSRSTGLVSAYDGEGDAHNVLISAYGPDGSRHGAV